MGMWICIRVSTKWYIWLPINWERWSFWLWKLRWNSWGKGSGWWYNWWCCRWVSYIIWLIRCSRGWPIAIRRRWSKWRCWRSWCCKWARIEWKRLHSYVLHWQMRWFRSVTILISCVMCCINFWIGPNVRIITNDYSIVAAHEAGLTHFNSISCFVTMIKKRKKNTWVHL